MLVWYIGVTQEYWGLVKITMLVVVIARWALAAHMDHWWAVTPVGRYIAIYGQIVVVTNILINCTNYINCCTNTLC